MRANYPIYRYDAEFGEYYTMFSAETIRKMAEKYLEENRQNRVNLMHCGEEVRGVQMVQLFIKDSAKGIIPSGFEDIEDGSLFAEFHIEDDEIWNWIKEGILRGFSLEGFFSMEEQFNHLDMGIDTKKWKRKLAAILAKFAEITTDKGVLTYEGDLAAGTDIYLINSDGEVVDAADGEYLAEDGRVIVVADGKIAEVREKAAEAEEENPGQIADDVDIHNLAAEVDRIKKELEHKKEEIADLKDRVSKLEGKADTTEEALRKMTAAQTAHQEVEGKETEQKFANKHEQLLYELSKA